MNDYGYIIAKSLHDKLTEKVRGSVQCAYNDYDDTITVVIQHNGNKFMYVHSNISKLALQNRGATMLTVETMTTYGHAVRNLFFKE